MDVINKDWGSSINYATIFYGGRRSMIEIKWLLNSNKVVVTLGRNGSRSLENTVMTFMDGPWMLLIRIGVVHK